MCIRDSYSFAHVSTIISAPYWVRDTNWSSVDSGRNFGYFGLHFDFVSCTGTAQQLDGATAVPTFPRLSRLLIELEIRTRHLWIQDEILDILVQISILWETRRRRYSFAHVSWIILASNWVRDSDSSSLDSGQNFGFFGADFNFFRCTRRALQHCARFQEYFGS